MSENVKPRIAGQAVLASRQNAKGVIADKIKREQKKVEALQVLLDELDWDNLTSRQEAALWDFFISR